MVRFIGLFLAINLIVAPVFGQLKEEPQIRVGLESVPNEFTLGASGDFVFADAATGNELLASKGEVKCVLTQQDGTVFSVFIDTFYTYSDAQKFAETITERFPEEATYKIFLVSGLYTLEVGEFATEDLANQAIKDLLSDIPKAQVTASTGATLNIGDKLSIRPTFDGTSYELLKVVAKKGSNAMFRGKRYRGKISLTINKGKLLVVNTLGLEDYLRGVVPAEMPASWGLEAIKSQAIAARTYAIRFTAKPISTLYDICSDTGCQVYAGLDREEAVTNRAIDATRGEVSVYDNKPIDAVFHSTSGGYTENSENVFVANVPYLRGVPSPGEEDSPRFAWFKTFNPEDFSTKIRPALKTDIGDVVDWKVTKQGVSGRAIRCEVIGTRGSAEVSASTVRSLLGLNSTWFDIVFVPESVVVCGRGWGHGAGLSQYGANAMAKDGKTYKEILSHYYQKTGVVKWY